MATKPLLTWGKFCILYDIPEAVEPMTYIKEKLAEGEALKEEKPFAFIERMRHASIALEALANSYMVGMYKASRDSDDPGFKERMR